MTSNNRIGTIIRLLLVLSAIGGIARGQVTLLNAGDSWTYHFTTLDYIGTEVRQIRPFSAEFMVAGTTNQNPGTLFYEAFEGLPPSEALLASQQTISGMECLITKDGAWQDLEGSIRMTVTEGSFILESVRFLVTRPNEAIPKSYDFFETTVVVPEPSTLTLLMSGLLVLWVYPRRVGWSRLI
jgi:hypothetical protein